LCEFTRALFFKRRDQRKKGGIDQSFSGFFGQKLRGESLVSTQGASIKKNNPNLRRCPSGHAITDEKCCLYGFALSSGQVHNLKLAPSSLGWHFTSGLGGGIVCSCRSRWLLGGGFGGRCFGYLREKR
jgi:hypothetical protein